MSGQLSAGVVARWHLDLAAWALAAGALVALVWLLRSRPPRARAHPLRALTLPAAVASLVGVWSAVPDTEAPLVAALVLAPLMFSPLMFSRQRWSPGPLATVGLCVTILATAWIGAAGWRSAQVMVFTVGLVAIAPLILGFGVRLPGRSVRWLAAVHIVTVLVIPRLIMRQPAGGLVAAVVTLALVIATVVAATGS